MSLAVVDQFYNDKVIQEPSSRTDIFKVLFETSFNAGYRKLLAFDTLITTTKLLNYNRCTVRPIPLTGPANEGC